MNDLTSSTTESDTEGVQTKLDDHADGVRAEPLEHCHVCRVSSEEAVLHEYSLIAETTDQERTTLLLCRRCNDQLVSQTEVTRP